MAPRSSPRRRGALPDHGAPSALAAGLSFQVVIRTRFFDYLLAACAGGHRQVVLLAAGLDTRAFRLDWPPSVRLFEVDLPEVLAFKEAVLRGQGAAPQVAEHELAELAESCGRPGGAQSRSGLITAVRE